MILCDTNILIEFYKGRTEVVETLGRLGISDLAVSVVTVGELYYGASIAANFVDCGKTFLCFTKFQ